MELHPAERYVYQVSAGVGGASLAVCHRVERRADSQGCTAASLCCSACNTLPPPGALCNWLRMTSPDVVLLQVPMHACCSPCAAFSLCRCCPAASCVNPLHASTFWLVVAAPACSLPLSSARARHGLPRSCGRAPHPTAAAAGESGCRARVVLCGRCVGLQQATRRALHEAAVGCGLHVISWLHCDHNAVCVPVFCCVAGRRLGFFELMGLWPPPCWHQRSAALTKHTYNRGELAAKAQ